MKDMNILEVAGGKPIKLWTQGVSVEEEARQQLLSMAKMPFIFKHLAVMSDVHLSRGLTIGSVIPTLDTITPAAVGVDIGCGMIVARTSLVAADLSDNLHALRSAIEQAVPHGKTSGRRDRGAWHEVPGAADRAWKALAGRFKAITDKHPRLEKTNNRQHLRTLGAGNHFIEVCLDKTDRVWFMLHSGSRGVDNVISNLFIGLAKADMRRYIANLPDKDLAYFEEGGRHFDSYVEAVGWAQDFARQDRALMMHAAIEAARQVIRKLFETNLEAVDCHHNYVQKERHSGQEVLVTRKGTVSAQRGQLDIIPGLMGAKSFIVRGLGNQEAFCSCSHGAERTMGRTKTKKVFSVADQARATAHVEYRKDADVIDEIPMAYKDIDRVMEAQREPVEVLHTLRQVVCVKG